MLSQRELPDLEDELQVVRMSPRTYVRPYSGASYGWALCYIWRLNHAGTGLVVAATGRVVKRGEDPGKGCWWDKGVEELTQKDRALRSGP